MSEIEIQVTAIVCDRDGLAFEDQETAEAHVSKDGCRWGVDATHWKSLAELQAQMDAAERDFDNREQALTWARSKINEASTHHRRVRVIRDEAKERLDAARTLWAEAAKRRADSILGGKT